MGYNRDISVRGYTDFVFTTSERKPIYPGYVNLELKRIVSSHNRTERELAEKES